MSNLKQVEILNDEFGNSLIEVMTAIIILGISLIGISSMIIHNQNIINLNTRQEEAIAVRNDVKEWLLYKAQIQDVANLNPLVFTEESSMDTKETVERRKHLILDNSGIQYTQNQSMYDEIPIDTLNEQRGSFIRKVSYDLSGANLPQSLIDCDSNRLYMGTYLSENEQETNYLVKILVENVKDSRDSYSYHDPRRIGLRLTIQIFNRRTGAFLTETYLNWVVDPTGSRPALWGNREKMSMV